jgi:phage recombination protein Bet
MSNLVVYSEDQIELLKKTIAKGASSDEFNLFINQCKRTGLDPFSKQIYFIKDNNGKVTIVSSIDGFRLIAERSGDYEGQTKTEWCGEDGVWKDVWLHEKAPWAARVGVYRSKFREALYGIAHFQEYAGYKANGDLTFMWNKMPALMIAKVAESLALRKAFPNDLSGIYSSDEMEQAEKETSDAKPTGNNRPKESNNKPTLEGSASAGGPSGALTQTQQDPKRNGASEKEVRNESPISMSDYQKLYEQCKVWHNQGKEAVDLRLKNMGIDSAMHIKQFQLAAVMKKLESK